ncbi:MAG: threonine synthase, partial [Thermoguttaceae bacterium]|nr:threonine synthase [Thermoguttaceae bacterium]
MHAFQQCINPACRATFDVGEVLHRCPQCGALLDVEYDWDKLPTPKTLAHFEKYWGDRADPLAFSGVWRFRELLPFAPREKCVTVGEGQTILQ